MRTTANEQGTTAFSSVTRWTHLFVVSLLVGILLTPTILCAIPNASLTPDEHACCEQMMGECGGNSVSSCCAIVPNSVIGIATPTEQLLPLSAQIEHAVISFTASPLPVPAAAAHLEIDCQSSPPDLQTPRTIQILRI